MKISGLRFLLLALLSLAACDSKPKISARDLKHQLETSVYEFNQDLNSADIDAAKSFVAPDAGPAFEALLAGYRGGKYNMFSTNDPPNIDYLGGKGYVIMYLHVGKHAAMTAAKEVERQTQLWVYSNGGWQWAGPVKR